ncbi:MAG: hypothetical protein H0Z33_00090 [Bacillaceae bacterium]|nr:hypothetical protein [Bacillaceae bacterium]
MIDFHLALDETRPTDTVIEVEGIPFFIDRFTRRYLDDELTLDHQPAQGFILSSRYEILSYGLTVYQSGEDVPPPGSSC